MTEILQRLDRIEALLKAAPPRFTVCNQAAFDRLPGLVSRAVFLEWTGWDKRDLATEVKAGRVAVYKPDGWTKARYYKREIGRLGGWKM
jgi:hypothetical protein